MGASVVSWGIDQKCFCLDSGCSLVFPVQQVLGALGYDALCLSGKRCVMYSTGNPLSALLMSV